MFRKCIALACALVLSACGDSSIVAGDRGGDAGGVPPSPPPKFGCGADDTPEQGVQGDIPRADKDSGRAAAGYNCGLSYVATLPATGPAQGYQHCVYVRTGANAVKVFDVRDPAAPVEITTLTPVGSNGGGGTSETLRVVVSNANPTTGLSSRALLVSGSSVYDIQDCEAPVHKGDIAWPGILPWPAGLSHDIRISHDGTKVYAGIGVVVADITDLDHPENWSVVNQSCAIAQQYHLVHTVPGLFDFELCQLSEDSLPQLSHGPDDNDTGTRLYIGNQGIPASVWIEADTLRIIDLTTTPPTILDNAGGPGHAIDWFRVADGREFILHSNEIAAVQQATCAPHPRPSNLGFAFEAFITEVTGDQLVRRSMLELDINKSQSCAAKLDSGQATSIAYQGVDNPYHASFATVSFGDSFVSTSSGPSGAGLRVFDIRDPLVPKEVAYFNRGYLQHASVTHYDPATGLLFMPGADAVQILELQPQVVNGLGLDYPTDPAYPRYPNGRAATPPG